MGLRILRPQGGLLFVRDPQTGLVGDGLYERSEFGLVYVPRPLRAHAGERLFAIG